MAKKNKKKSSFFSDFKKFISRGSVIDLAVGVVIGSSFTAIVNGIVKGLIMPLVGLIVGDGLNGLYFAVGETGEVAAETMTTSNGVVIEVGDMIYKAYFTYGEVLQAILNFLIIALVIFTIVRIIRKANEKAEKLLKKQEEEQPAPAPAPAPVPEDIVLLTEIRDLLKEKKSE